MKTIVKLKDGTVLEFKTIVKLKDGTVLEFKNIAPMPMVEDQNIDLVDPHCVIEGNFDYADVDEVIFKPETER